ncbi:hypothetical protein B0O80DRAFT_495137 [Mortierella sp. GBAus27b]|nr:hypothetical protein BGX31_003675 [Mortierella sp. GBA43]KAI8359624.1 hypothetical protein B0O80DRAFT_495137 [Mortierella sp. GBAus27b]
MTSNCNGSHSNSQYPPFCCVHNPKGSERAPLLGYHHHAHPQHQPQHQQLQGDYYIDVPGYPYGSSCDGKRNRKHKYLARILGFFFGITLFYFFFHRYHSHSHPYIDFPGMNPLSQGNKGIGASSDSCLARAVEWDGPSTFVTDARHFSLHLGSDPLINSYFASDVQIHTSNQVQQPTFIVQGKISPLEGGQIQEEVDGDVTRISYLGLEIEIRNNADVMEAKLWFHDRWVDNDGGYRACASFQLAIILPATFTSYETISIEGPIMAVNYHDLSNIRFRSIHVKSSVGHITAGGDVFVDQLDVQTATGDISFDSIHVANRDEGISKPLDVKTQSQAGQVKLGLTANFVNQDESQPHRVVAASSVGSVTVNLRTPTDQQIPAGKKPGDVDIQATSNVGLVQPTVQLFNDEQALKLTAKTNTGSVEATISDKFLGRFNAQTSFGSVKVQPAVGSRSVIRFERQGFAIKAGQKVRKDGSGGDRGDIDIRSNLGSAKLWFN